VGKNEIGYGGGNPEASVPINEEISGGGKKGILEYSGANP
jgi:hypothetical protein